MKVAVTGTVASGKSSVCQIFKEQGAYVVSADDIVHKHLTPNTILGKKVIALLGSGIVVSETIDRQKVAKKVFQNATLLQALEKLVHPVVRREILAASQGQQVFVAEIPLLFECGWESDYDVTVAVVSDPSICKDRFAATDASFEKRQERMLSAEEKEKRADFTIHNNGSLEELKQQVNQLNQTIKERFTDGK